MVRRCSPSRSPVARSVAVLFRQLIGSGAIGAAWDDALDGLGLDDFQAPLVRWIGDLSGPARAELRSEVERQADGLRRRWPALDPAWLPRTHESIRVPLSGGRYLLSARVDLVLGRPAGDMATVALVGVTSGVRWAGHAADRHFDALVETLRSGAPPFAVATYWSRTGELEVDPVTPELLAAAARRCLAGVRAMTGVVGASAADDRYCDGCASTLPQRRPPLVGVPASTIPASTVSVPTTSSATPSPVTPAAAPVVTRGGGTGDPTGFPDEWAA